MTKKYYIVETTSQFKIRYVVSTENELKNGRLQHLIDDSQISEISQNFLGEKITGVEEYSLESLQEKFDGDSSIFGNITDHINDIDADVVEMLDDNEQF